jgi:hypothetical protein
MATIVTRAGKGSALEWTELDANFNNINGELARATGAEVRELAATSILTPDNVKDATALVTLTDAASIAVAWTAFAVAQVTLSGNRTIANPSATVVGSTRYVFVKGNNATARTLTFGSNYKGDLPTLTDITSTKWYLLTLVCYSSTHIVVAAVRAL